MCRVFHLILLIQFFDSFVCYANLLHSPFFLAFCRLDGKQMDWRVNYLSQLIQQHLPSIHKHFEELNLSLTHFYIDWCRALYAKQLPLDVASRVWDLYLLHGEIVAVQVALTILRYYQAQLVRGTYDECIYLLTFPAAVDEQEMNETRFWDDYASICAVTDVPAFNRLYASHSGTSNKPASFAQNLRPGFLH